ncbi:aspartate carbamoyltransferase catalytic subunit [Parvularcula sp. LCG005]|uniref:aspartate carbamoyltransferase catalytic subunit n=1 Tax=Parvularcula sp. LCG005 TaxID=3078805 RepID=UPI00294340C8|nr:aspartate carbamoyltransferase catalytic subunit [Parvularcula sp. LCG005]WOI52744.1 aspartate carbamoyltransferase catalytic subunit [Parvularcula sp. LCG005]
MTTARHLTDIASLDDEALLQILERSLTFRRMMDQGRYPKPVLEGRLQFNLFFENSTRTNLSFEVAAKRLGAIVSVVPVAASSVHKGETVDDTVVTLCAQGADYLVIRAAPAGTIASAVSVIERNGYPTSILNAGEGALGHPTQGLLDVSSVLYALKRQPDDRLEDVRLSICGDIRHSRVAASAIEGFSRMGAQITLVGPSQLLPSEKPAGVAAMIEDLGDGIDGADVVMALRIQKERFGADEGLSLDGFHEQFGLNHAKLKRASPDAIVMHPGPMNRGVEISDALADDPERSLIRSQVTHGVATRMAVLEWLEEARR